MRTRPTAFGWINTDITTAPAWDAAQVRRLARQLGFRLEWPPENTLLHIADAARAAEIDAVIVPAPQHLDPIELQALMFVTDVESVSPRRSFVRGTALKAGT